MLPTILTRRILEPSLEGVQWRLQLLLWITVRVMLVNICNKKKRSKHRIDHRGVLFRNKKSIDNKQIYDISM